MDGASRDFSKFLVYYAPFLSTDKCVLRRFHYVTVKSKHDAVK